MDRNDGRYGRRVANGRSRVRDNCWNDSGLCCWVMGKKMSW